MDQDTKKLLEDNLALNKENNELLQKLYRVHRFAQITRIIYWVLLLGIAAGAFYFIQPFFDSILGAYGIGSVDVRSLLK